MFGKKTMINDTASQDLAQLLSAIDAISSGKNACADASAFNDKTVCEKLNRLIDSMKAGNNPYVMKLNTAMNDIGDSSCVKDMIEQVEAQSASISDMNESAEALRGSVENVLGFANDISKSASSSSELSKGSVLALKESAAEVNAANTTISDVTGKIQEVKDKLGQITQIVDVVKQIANKSSLLALNASIEAARAGAAGASFAVVAVQMQQLAQNTSKSATDVVTYVSGLQESLEEMFSSINDATDKLASGNTKMLSSVSDIETMSRDITEIDRQISLITNEVNTQHTLADKFMDSVGYLSDNYKKLSDQCFSTGSHLYKISRGVDSARSNLARDRASLSTMDWLDVFITDHLIFTWRQYNNLIGFETLKLEQVNNPDGCKLGKWLNSVKDPRITGSDAFKRVNSVHRDLHASSVKCFNAAKNNDRALAMRYFDEAFGHYETLTNALKDLKKLYH